MDAATASTTAAITRNYMALRGTPALTEIRFPAVFFTRGISGI
jgi:hypothetical protein